MGNKIARTTQVSASEYYLHDLPTAHNVVLKEVLGRGRFFKSILCKHDEGLVVVKVYFKRGDPIDLREHERRLLYIKDTFLALDHPHIWPFQFWQETDKAAYLIRQYFFSNLHDRLSTRPFLSLLEKKWLAFQLLLAVKQCHNIGICHGDIKCENVLVTSWNWVYLADFASFKPTYIPYDDPSDFSFFFDTGGRRLCYLAPERFYEHGGEMQISHDTSLKTSMDIFSVGCVMAELFLEGQHLFELSQLLAYRRGQYDPIQHLEKIPDSGIRQMILHMIQLEPEARLSAESYLDKFATVVFPSYFSLFLHNFYCCWNPLHADMRVAMCQGVFPEILKHIISCQTDEKTGNMVVPSSNYFKDAISPRESLKAVRIEAGSSYSQHDILGVINSFICDVKNSDDNSIRESSLSSVSPLGYEISALQSPNEFLQAISNAFRKNGHPFLKNITGKDLNTLMSEYDVQSDTFGMPFLPLPGAAMRHEGMVLITSLLCSCIRNVKLPHLRRSAILLLKSSALYTDDEDRLQRVLPCVIAMLSDNAAIVRCAALETLCDILPLVRDLPPSDAKIFPEYILPMLSMLPDDTEESVRICYASNISKLALTAYGFLINMSGLTEAGVLDETSSLQKLSLSSPEMSRRNIRVGHISQLRELRKSIAEVIQELVMGPKQTPNIRRALLQDIGNICSFFGQKQSNDFLLPVLPAFLNDRDEQLRALFYGKIVYVCFFVGQRSLEEYLLPYIEQALHDQTEAVIVNALECLSILCKNGLLRKRKLLEMIERAFPLLCYPSRWVRQTLVVFIAASSKHLGAVDSYVFLAPLVNPFLYRQSATLDSEKSLLISLKPPVSRRLFYEVLENARSSDMLERQRKIWYNSSAQLNHSETGDLLKREEYGPKITADIAKKLRSNDNKGGNDMMNNHIDLKMKSSGLENNNTSVIDHYGACSEEKVQCSGHMSPLGEDHMSFTYDRTPEGIPLYSFSMDQRAIKNVPAASDSSVRMNSLGFGSSYIPWMDPINKSFSLASSVPTPKFVSGSFSITGGSKQFYRVVHEPEGRDSDNSTVFNAKLHDMGLPSPSKGTYLTLDDSSATADQINTSFTRASLVPDSGWKPRGVLVAHLQEHRSAVNDIAVSNDHSFFVTASDDSTIKVWDSRKLEKDISFRSRLSYHLDGSRGMCCVMFRDSHQVVVGDCDGVLHTFSVDHISRGLGNVVERYSGIVDTKRKSIKEGAILDVVNYAANVNTSQTVIYSTQNCGIHLWDMRESANAWTLKALPEEGYISSIVASPCGNWLVSGSSRAVLILWDLRFLLPVNKWQYSQVCSIEKICLFVPPNAMLSSTSRPLVYVAAGCNEVSLWNAENGSCHQVLRLANYGNDATLSNLPWALSRSPQGSFKHGVAKNVNPKYKVDDLNEPPSRFPGVRSMIPLPGGDLLTGGSDMRIRRWDHNSPERSYSVCGPNVHGSGIEDIYERKSSYGVQVVQEVKRPHAMKGTAKSILAAAATDPAGCHRDSILSLASVKLNQRLLISSSRDGAIKVWK